VREQRIGQEWLLDRLEVVGVPHVLDERAVDRLDGIVDDQVLVGEPIDHRRQRAVAVHEMESFCRGAISVHRRSVRFDGTTYENAAMR
jgi:hypothetical protein